MADGTPRLGPSIMLVAEGVKLETRWEEKGDQRGDQAAWGPELNVKVVHTVALPCSSSLFKTASNFWIHGGLRLSQRIPPPSAAKPHAP